MHRKGSLKALLLALSLSVGAPALADDTLVKIGDFFYHTSQIGAVGYSYLNHGPDGALGCAAAAVANNAATRVIKRTINQPRPNGGPYGMPSGHTSRVATSFGCLLGQEGWTVPTIGLGIATAVTGYSRTAGDYHTPKQVLAGAALGTTLGYLGTQHLFLGRNEIAVSIPLGGASHQGAAVTDSARKAIIDFANRR